MDKAEKLETLILNREYLELYDILETKRMDQVKNLLKSNIKYLINKHLGKGSVEDVQVEIEDVVQAGEQQTTDTILGQYLVYFKDGSEYDGNFIADGTIYKNKFQLVAIFIGSKELRFFG